MIMKRFVSAVALLAFHLPQSTLAKDGSPSRRIIDIKRHGLPGRANAPSATNAADIGATAKTAPVMDVDAGRGKSLAQLLSELNAEVEWSNERLSTVVVKGAYHGLPETIAQAALGDLNYAIFHDHSRLRIVVMSKTPTIETAKLTEDH
jgi:hypothetical protein